MVIVTTTTPYAETWTCRVTGAPKGWPDGVSSRASTGSVPEPAALRFSGRLSWALPPAGMTSGTGAPAESRLECGTSSTCTFTGTLRPLTMLIGSLARLPTSSSPPWVTIWTLPSSARRVASVLLSSASAPVVLRNAVDATR
jgi:hypothetical protein